MIKKKDNSMSHPYKCKTENESSMIFVAKEVLKVPFTINVFLCYTLIHLQMFYGSGIFDELNLS